ncbi:LamG domain-containing protein [Labilibacter marinus]|uniref:family 16 glycosylhydrolase n=1 Tax=Labilibacter marinus TaxID=1477105 RepID=UPI0009FA5B49|nr:family 16 glycosylhydrolase [Labilibacter marinus]
MMKKYILAALLISFVNALQADPPKPPMGKRWVMNTDFSDEFNGTSLDTEKWLDHHPSWKGRVPGLFLPSQVSVADGYLQIRGEKMDKDTVIHAYGKDLTYNIKGGAVVSKKSVFLGYYECRAKAAATTMSTTFWFSSGKGFDGPNDCDKYGLEWDIQECIGRNGDFDGSYFANGMHSNSHYWYTDCDKKRHDHRASQVKFNDKELASADFHVYGGWWHDETRASYYYDNGEPKYQKFYNKVSDKPFDQPMFMRLVCETYPFPWISLPTDEELADTTKNVVRYDWVRGYELVNADKEINQPTAPEADIHLYYEDVMFESTELQLTQGKTISIPMSYKANDKRTIQFTLKDAEGKKVMSTTFNAFAGYANKSFQLQLDKKLNIGSEYKLTAAIKPIGGDNKSVINESTLIVTFKK